MAVEGMRATSALSTLPAVTRPVMYPIYPSHPPPPPPQVSLEKLSVGFKGQRGGEKK